MPAIVDAGAGAEGALANRWEGMDDDHGPLDLRNAAHRDAIADTASVDGAGADGGAPHADAAVHREYEEYGDDLEDVD